MQPDSLSAQIVIPVHAEDRPIRRAVGSVLANPGAGAVVVAHNIDPALLDLPDDPRVQLVELSDGTRYPGAAFNRGIAAATAPWVGVMGSDDWYEPGAIDSMLMRAEVNGADGVIAPLRYNRSKENESNPMTWRRSKLHAARDRLFFRTAPLGLFRRGIFDDPRFLFDDDVVAGVDQRNSVLLYASGLNIAHDPRDPAYVVGDDATERVSTNQRPLAEQTEAWGRLWEDPDILSLPPKVRKALAEKFTEMHLLQIVAARPRLEQWLDGDFDWLSGLANRVLELEPDLDRGFVRARAAILRELAKGTLESTLDAQDNTTYADWRLPKYATGPLRPNFRSRRRLASRLSRWRDRLDNVCSQKRKG